MQYVAQVSGKGKEVDRVKEQLLQSIPVLEGRGRASVYPWSWKQYPARDKTPYLSPTAFGNAKTNSNDNSSRFVSALSNS